MTHGRICVLGLWHLGCVTAACLAEQGFKVVGLDPDADRVDALARGEPPIAEPGLGDLLAAGLRAGRLRFTSEASRALRDTDVLWVAFDTPVDDQDRADVAWLRTQLDVVRPHVRAGTLVLVSSQVPVGFTRALEREWRLAGTAAAFACSPENLRLGRAISAFKEPGRVVVGLGDDGLRGALRGLFAPFTKNVLWMSFESAEMTKHALNAFLALSAAYANELARICERVGADARNVERGLRSDPRVGAGAYVAPGPPIAGGTLARDVAFLMDLSGRQGLESPIVRGIQESNEIHRHWAEERVRDLLLNRSEPAVAVLGLTYKPGTDTLRRSSALELARSLAGSGVAVHAYDPAVRQLPAHEGAVFLHASIEDALEGADAAVLATAWPEFATITGDMLVRRMRQPALVDQAGFLPNLEADPRLQYVRVGRPAQSAEDGK